jgi:hypothetical protein
MPFYYKLRIQKFDKPARRVEKKRIAQRILTLRKDLLAHVGSGESRQCDDDGHDHDSVRYLRLATWNIREFDSEKFGERMEEAYYYIAEIISNFDLVAIQEVRENLAALDEVVRLLGPSWTYVATDVTEGKAGNRERMAYVYNERKVWFRRIAGELVLSKDLKDLKAVERLQVGAALSLQLPDGAELASPAGVETSSSRGAQKLKSEVAIPLPEGTLVELPAGCEVVLPYGYEVTLTDDGRVELPEGSQVTFEAQGTKKDKRPILQLPARTIVDDELQFARTPSLVAFQCGWLKINLCTVHIYYGEGKKGLARRKEEIRRLTSFLSQRAVRDNDSDNDSFYVVLGDFNIISKDHETMEALQSNGFKVPKALQNLPAGSNVQRDKSYDQIAYWNPADEMGWVNPGITQIDVHRAGVFDFFKSVFRRGDDDPGGQDEAFYTARMPKLSGFKESWKYSDWRTYQMSDHLPMWIELRIEFADEYLQMICDTPDED